MCVSDQYLPAAGGLDLASFFRDDQVVTCWRLNAISDVAFLRFFHSLSHLELSAHYLISAHHHHIRRTAVSLCLRTLMVSYFIDI